MTLVPIERSFRYGARMLSVASRQPEPSGASSKKHTW